MTMTYDVSAIEKKLNGYSLEEQAQGKEQIRWFKPSVGMHTVRFLPYRNREGLPFEEILFYNFSFPFIPCPYQFGFDDVVLEFKRTKEFSELPGDVKKKLKPVPKYFAPILANEEVFVWDMRKTIVESVYKILIHPDYRDENMFDLDKGYDFVLTVSDTDKKINGFVVKNYSIQPRRKPSRCSYRGDIPNIFEYFKSSCERSIPDLSNRFHEFLSKLSASDVDDADVPF